MLEVHVSITGIAIFVVILLVFLVGLLVYLYPVSMHFNIYKPFA